MVGQCCFILGFLLAYSQVFNLSLGMVRSLRALLSHLQGKVWGALTHLWVWSQVLDSSHALGEFSTHSGQVLTGSEKTHDRSARRNAQFELLQEHMNSQGLECSKKKFSRQKLLYLASLGLVEIKDQGKVVGFRAQSLFVALFLPLSLLIVLLGSVLTQKFLLIFLGI